MSFGPKKPFRVIFGSAHSGSLSYVIWSFSNASLSLTVGSEQATVTSWTQVGTDNAGEHPEACFVASGTVTIPTAFTLLSWSATQGANTESGDVPTQPGMYDDYRVLEGTCNYTGAISAESYPHPGVYPLAKTLMEDTRLPPVAAYIHMDDIIYLDAMRIDDTGHSEKVTTDGPNGTPQATLKQFDYALGWACAFGGLGGNETDTGCQAGRYEGLQYLLDHARFRPMWGNHELQNEAGRSGTTGGTLGLARPNAFHATGTEGVEFTGDGAGKVVYEAMIEPLHGQRLGTMRDAQAKHYYDDFGCWRVVFGDFITRNEGSVSSGVYGDHFFGFNQIDDMLEMADAARPFTTLMMGPSTRGFTDVSGEFNALSNFPDDYNRLLLNTGQTLKSLMDNPWTSGVYGTLTLDHGDSHSGGIKWHYAPAATGKARENFYSIQLGSMTRTSGLHGRFTMDGVADDVSAFDDTTAELYAEYRRKLDKVQADPVNGWLGPHMLERIVYGSEVPPRHHLRMWAETGTPGEFAIVWERHLIQHHGNRGKESPSTPKFGVAVGNGFE